MLYYAGIGSRETPDNVREDMARIAEILAQNSYILRSGGAPGADTAFEIGYNAQDGKSEIFIPWNGFGNAPQRLRRNYIVPDFTPQMCKIAEDHHPAWHKCSPAAKKLHTRNVCQILGEDLHTPVKFVVCWTPNGKVVGGTGHTLRMALDNNIPIFNLFHADALDKLEEHVNETIRASAK